MLKMETKLILVPNLLFLVIVINRFCAGEWQPQDGRSALGAAAAHCSKTHLSHGLLPTWHPEQALCNKAWQRGTRFLTLCQAPNGPGQKSPGKAIYCCHSFENAISRGRACAAMQGSLAITQPQLLVPSSQPIHQAILPLRELLRMSKGRTKPRFPALRSPTASCEMTGQLVIEQKGPTEPAGMPDISAATRDSQSCPNS